MAFEIKDQQLMRKGVSMALLIAIMDQISKWAIMEGVFNLSFWPPVQGFPWVSGIEIFPFFNLVTVWNQGVSFGLFADSSDMTRWLLIFVTSLIALGMLVWLMRAETKFLALSLGLVLGGAVGNIIDRLRFGAVFDFLDFSVMSYHWPAFNIADAGITVGAVLILLEGLFEKKTQED